MVLRAENNPFPSILMVEQDKDALTEDTPAAGQQRLVVDSTDHLFYLVDDTDTATLVGGGVTDHGALTGLSDDDHTQYVLRSILTTNGDLFTRTGGAVARLGVGSDGDVLTVASGAPSWAAPTGGGGGGLVLLEQHTASSSATLDFTSFISSTYDDYEFRFVDIMPVTDTAVFRMRVGTGGGPTYDTGNNYQWASYVATSGASGQNGGTSQDHISISGGEGMSTVSSSIFGMEGRMGFSNPNSALAKKVSGVWNMVRSTGPSLLLGTVVGLYVPTTAVTAIRFYMSSGNIASGTVRVYGVEK